MSDLDWISVPLAASRKGITVVAIRKAIGAGHIKTCVPANPEAAIRPRGGQVSVLVYWPDVEAMRGRGGPPKGTDTGGGHACTEAKVLASKANGAKGGRPKKSQPSTPDPGVQSS